MHLSPSSLVFFEFLEISNLCVNVMLLPSDLRPPTHQDLNNFQGNSSRSCCPTILQNRNISFHRDVLGHVIHLNSSVSEILLMFLYPCVQVFVTLRERKRRSEWRRNAKENDPQQAISRVISLTTGAAAQVQSFDQEQY